MEQHVSSTPFFKQARPIAIRFWHWITFAFFWSSIITVIFGSTLFKTKNNITMVQEQVQAKGGTITPEQARNVAHEYSDKLWMLHKYIGYGLCLLFLWRVIVEMIVTKEKSFIASFKKTMTFPVKNAEQKHYLMVQWSYLIFYLLFFLMALTGLVLAYEDVKWLEPVHEAAGELHEILQYFLYTYIILHIAGAVIADSNQYNGIISRMIHGKRKEDERNGA